jgi:hypothetical protein
MGFVENLFSVGDRLYLAEHWYEVTGVRVCEIQMLSINDLERACWTNDWEKVTSWDEIYPNHLWNADLSVVVMELEEVAK